MWQIYKWDTLVLETWTWWGGGWWVSSCPLIIPNAWVMWFTDDARFIPSVVAWTWIYIYSPLNYRITDTPTWVTNVTEYFSICIYKWYVYVFFHNTSSSTYRPYLYVKKADLSLLPTLTWTVELSSTNIGNNIHSSDAKCLWMDDNYFYLHNWWFAWTYKVERWTWTTTILPTDDTVNNSPQYSTMRINWSTNEFLIYSTWWKRIFDESWNILYDTWVFNASWWAWVVWFFTVWDKFYAYTYYTLTASTWTYRIWLPLPY